jgi:hypothetical protein
MCNTQHINIQEIRSIVTSKNFSIHNQQEKVTGDWRELHNDELHNSYSSPHAVRLIGWAWHAACMGEMGIHSNF